jgi:hypothetical protein
MYNDIHNIELKTIMYKHFHHQLPAAFEGFFTKQSVIYQTRNTDNYILPKTKTKFSSKSVRNTGPKQWNTLQKDIRYAKSIKIFKKHLKSNIIQSYD